MKKETLITVNVEDNHSNKAFLERAIQDLSKTFGSNNITVKRPATTDEIKEIYNILANLSDKPSMGDSYGSWTITAFEQRVLVNDQTGKGYWLHASWSVSKGG